MKKFILILLLFSVFSAKAQSDPKYYNWNGEPCELEKAMFASSTLQTDSGWVKFTTYIATGLMKDKALFSDSGCAVYNGWYMAYYPNKNIRTIGRLANNKKEGLWLQYHYNGMMEDSTVYKDNKPVGISLGWYPNGSIADSTFYGSDGINVEVKWFDNGAPSSAGKTKDDKNIGIWQFFHKNGVIACREWFDDGVLKKCENYNEEGNLDSNKYERNEEARFPGGEKAWNKYVDKHIYFPSHMKFTYAKELTTVVLATIDEDGKMVDAYVEVPVYPDFDEVVIRVMKKSPQWTPALEHNRNVRSQKSIVVSFGQEQN